MNAAMEYEGKKHPEKEIVPAALLYYHIDDPSVETPVELTPEEFADKIGGFASRLEKLFEEGHRLEAGIKEQLERVKYEN